MRGSENEILQKTPKRGVDLFGVLIVKKVSALAKFNKPLYGLMLIYTQS